ncbi:AraC family transcriptional regulator [Segatella copri]
MCRCYRQSCTSYAHLYKIFKAKTGFTPGQWRDSVLKKR